MTGSSQFDAYAAFYDLLYKDKNYKGEAEYISKLINRFLKKDKAETSVLDLACGTGKHLFELASEGYGSLSGSDISSSMIEIARKNATAKGKNVTFYNHSFQESDKISSRFDIVLSMFSAFNYLTTYADQSKTLNNISTLLNHGGLFIFDYWNGCAVTEMYSPVKVLRKSEGSAEILRISETKLNLIEQSATVKFNCNYFQDNKRMADFQETHHLHYYYFSEMRNLLESHQFDILYIAPFMQLDKDLSPDEWNISIVARKKHVV